MSTIAPDSISPVAALVENENSAATATGIPVIISPPSIATVDTLTLQAALAKYVKVIANKNARLIIQGIRIFAAHDRLDLFGTDLEIGRHVAVPANAITIPFNVIVADY